MAHLIKNNRVAAVCRSIRGNGFFLVPTGLFFRDEHNHDIVPHRNFERPVYMTTRDDRKRIDRISSGSGRTRVLGGEKPPGEGIAVFQVGNTGNSLLNVHKAVQAFREPARTSKKTTGDKKLIVTDGAITVSPHDFVDSWDGLKRVAKKNAGLIVNILDPMPRGVSAKFTFGVPEEVGVEKVSVSQLMRNGVAALLSLAKQVNIAGYGMLVPSSDSDLLPLPRVTATHGAVSMVESSRIVNFPGFKSVMREVAERGAVTIGEASKPLFILLQPHEVDEQTAARVEVRSRDGWRSVLMSVLRTTRDEDKSVVIFDKTSQGQESPIAVARPLPKLSQSSGPAGKGLGSPR